MNNILPASRTFYKKNRHIVYAFLGIFAVGQLLPIIVFISRWWNRTQDDVGTSIHLPYVDMGLATLGLFLVFLVVQMTKSNRMQVTEQGVKCMGPGTIIETSWENIERLSKTSSWIGTRYKLLLKDPVPIQHSPDWWPFQQNTTLQQLDLTAYLRPIELSEFEKLMQTFWH